jgi:endoribonuclease Dicer
MIMREYRLISSTDRPKVFGMTASPIWNTKNPEESLKFLESTLDAKVVAVKDHADELVRNVQKPTEVNFPNMHLHPEFLTFI